MILRRAAELPAAVGLAVDDGEALIEADAGRDPRGGLGESKSGTANLRAGRPTGREDEHGDESGAHGAPACEGRTTPGNLSASSEREQRVFTPGSRFFCRLPTGSRARSSFPPLSA